MIAGNRRSDMKVFSASEWLLLENYNDIYILNLMWVSLENYKVSKTKD